MAGGNKKKKKPIANPARGFATTSIASKVKVEKSPEGSNDASEVNSTAATATPSTTDDVNVQSAARSEVERELHELSPEELERQLEQSELQQAVEQHGPKAHKEASRHVSRLVTDRRVLRGQAEFLSLKDWLPDELMQQIIELTVDDPSNVSAPDSRTSGVRTITEDVLVSRIWQLQLILESIDIPEGRISETIRYVLSHPPTEASASSAWGLNDALEYLAIACGSNELLDFDQAKPKARVLVEDEQDTAEGIVDGEPISTKKGTSIRNTAQDGPLRSQSENGPSHESQDDIQVSDLDSDLEPEDMVSEYLKAKSRLFERNPELVGETEEGGKRVAKRFRGNQTTRATAGETQLQQRLKILEADVLFDKLAADTRWRAQKIDLMKKRTARKRLDLGDEPHQNAKSSTDGERMDGRSADVLEEAEELGRKLLEEVEDDDDGVLGGMFDAIDSVNQVAQNHAQDSANISSRNFGKITGMSPRRILEDACRSRDSGARIRITMISPTTYSCRHAIRISWSKDRDSLDTEYGFLTGFRLTDNSRSTVIEMQGVAAPEVPQSEGYAATVALFILFSGSPKEEKASLRLPPAFRDLWQELVTVKKEHLDSQDREVFKKLRRVIRDQRVQEDEEDVILTIGLKNRSKAASGVSTPVETNKPLADPTTEQSTKIKDIWFHKASSPAFQQMLLGRKELPMYHFREVALSAVRQNQVTILCGETGCGKSTQMPSFILEDELSQGRDCKIYCTEPRRISAISLAQRVSEELGEAKGAVGTPRSLVGYAIRLESQTVASTRLVYATVGIVLRMLESEKGIKDITHLVIDEIHERSIDTDFLLIVLRSLMVRRPDLKVVLMSATVDAQKFSQYLGGAPIVTVPGRTFPVRAMFLEDAIEVTGHTIEDNSQGNQVNDDADDDEMENGPKEGGTAAKQQLAGYSRQTIKTLGQYDEYKIDYALIIKLLETVAYKTEYKDFSKAVLVFCPGIAEIRQLNDMLSGHPAFSQGWLIYPLHSTFSSEEQQAAFKVPPRGMRKIVLATNIAETGITIPDVTCVIDTGKHKEMRFDERRQLSRLIQAFISRANAKQRRGRAGRVQEGICFHLFTKYRHDEIMADQQTPEMLRLSLQDLVMRVKICKLGDIEHALSAALDPPSLKNIRRAIDALIEVDALTSGEELTPLGQQLAKLPLDAQLGKLILLGTFFGCLDFALTTAAIQSTKSPFVAPMGAKKQADTVRLGFKRGDSDLLTAYNAYVTWKRVCMTPGSSEMQFCRKNFLSQQNLSNIEELKGQLMSSLSDAGFVTLTSDERVALGRVRQSGRMRTFVPIPVSHNAADANDILINAVTSWSFYPRILTREGKGWRNIGNNQSISLHPTSVNKQLPSPTFEATKYLSFYSIMQSSSRFTNAQETSPAEAMALVLLAGDAVFYLYAGVVIIDGNRLRFKVRDWKTMIALKALRSKMKEILARGFKNPGWELSSRQREWFKIVVGMFERVQSLKADRR